MNGGEVGDFGRVFGEVEHLETSKLGLLDELHDGPILGLPGIGDGAGIRLWKHGGEEFVIAVAHGHFVSAASVPEPPHHGPRADERFVVEESGQDVDAVEEAGGGRFDFGDGAESRKPVGTVDGFFADRAGFDLAGLADDAGDVDAAVVHVSLGAAEMAGTAEGGSRPVFGSVVGGEDDEGAVGKAFLVEIVHESANVVVEHGDAAKVQVGALELGSAFDLWTARCGELFDVRCDSIVGIELSELLRGENGRVRFAEPKAGEERLVWVALIEPSHGFIDDEFAHPSTDFSGGCAVAKKGLRVFAEVGGVGEPVVETVITGSGLSAGIEITGAMPFAGEHRLVTGCLEPFGNGGFFNRDVKRFEAGEVIHADAIGTASGEYAGARG